MKLIAHQLKPAPRCHRRVRPRTIRRTSVSSFLVLLAVTCLSPPAQAIGPYSVSPDMVLDQRTGLVWQKSDDGTPRNWQEALAYCQNLAVDLQNDWRLPNIRELKSIVAISRYYPAIEPAFSCRLATYWSATTVADYPTSYGWVVYFANGDDNWEEKTKKYYIRCVRSGLPEK